MIEGLCISVVFGALLYRSLHLGLFIIGIISALTGAFFFMYFLSRRMALLGTLYACAVFLGAFRMSLESNTVPQELFLQKGIQGRVETVDRRLEKTLVVVREERYGKKIQVSLRSGTDALPGDTVSVYGTIEAPKDFETDTGRTFEYQNYLQSKGIVGLVGNGGLHVVAPGGFSLTKLATKVRFYIAHVFSVYVQFPVDGIVSGMLVGYQGSLPQWLSDLFRTTGVLHVLVLSGENITLMAVFMAVVFRALPFKVRTVVTAFAIIMIVLVSGAGVAAVRSGIMGSIALSAGLVRRGYVPLRALTISIMFYFVTSPSTLFVDPGFHLSVLATIFMILILPKLQRVFSFLPEKYGIREILILAFCVPLFMLPYTMYFSGLESLASPVANIVMVAAVPTIMLLGAGILALSWFVPMAQLLGILLSFVGRMTIAVLKLCDRLPQLNTPPIPWWGVVSVYAVAFAILFRKEIRQHSSSFARGSR